MKSTITLQDVADKDSRTEVNYLVNPCGIEIGFKGFGECCMQKGFGHPVFIEIRNGIPFVLIWGDINDENPTQTISLAGALEKLRNKEDCCAICNKPLKGEVVIGVVGKSRGQRCHQECDALEREEDDEDLNK